MSLYVPFADGHCWSKQKPKELKTLCKFHAANHLLFAESGICKTPNANMSDNKPLNNIFYLNYLDTFI
jgi:hypothetical protein